jgi:hypothetical protein
MIYDDKKRCNFIIIRNDRPQQNNWILNQHHL